MMKTPTSLLLSCLVLAGVGRLPGASDLPPPPAVRTQFDGQLLSESVSSAPAVLRNTGRQVVALSDGLVVTALAIGGEKPELLIWKRHALMRRADLAGTPSAPLLLAGPAGTIGIWISAAGIVYHASDLGAPLAAVDGLRGTLEDAASTPDGGVDLVLSQHGDLTLASFKDRALGEARIDTHAGHASLEFDDAGALHLAYEKGEGIEYRCLAPGFSLDHLRFSASERAAEAYGFHPTLLAANGRIFLAYLGESSRPPSAKKYTDAWERLGQGGYIGVLVRHQGHWQRFKVAESKQVAKPFWPPGPTFASMYNNPALRVAIEKFSPPAISIGPDRVVEVLWANTTRRWIYSSRFLGGSFSVPEEVRGPLEQLTGPGLVSRHVPDGLPGLPLAMPTLSRAYLDQLALPARQVVSGRHIDFLQPDQLSACRDLELALFEMKRVPENPVIPVGPPGAYDDGAVVSRIIRAHGQWSATYGYEHVLPTPAGPRASPWQDGGRATSPDGIHWTKLEPRAAAKATSIPEVPSTAFMEDPEEKDPQHRFKGLVRASRPRQEGRGYRSVVSPDGVHWSFVEDTDSFLVGDDEMNIYRDLADVPERRFKATAISWSHGGRICVEWTSADGVHWNDVRNTLDFDAPFQAPPYPFLTGRMLVDAWAGPDSEDEIHGGVLFRDGDRWLVHYMPWTADGHIYLALASSRDGINFTRVASGKATVALGEAGTWDAGRVAAREPPFQVGQVWRQFYVGSGWKHGQGGVGSQTSWIGTDGPNETGCAEIPVGHWGALRLAPGADEGEFTTTVCALAAPHSLTLDLEGLGRPGSSVRCAVIDPATGRPIPGFDFSDFDPGSGDGTEVAAAWKRQGTDSLGARDVQFAVRVTGPAVKLYGMNLRRGTPR